MSTIAVLTALALLVLALSTAARRRRKRPVGAMPWLVGVFAVGLLLFAAAPGLLTVLRA